MCSVSFELPDDSLLALKVAPENAASELRLAAAVKLYEMGRLSSGAAARLAGIPRTVFSGRLADYGVLTFVRSRSELEEEVALA